MNGLWKILRPNIRNILSHLTTLFRAILCKPSCLLTLMLVLHDWKCLIFIMFLGISVADSWICFFVYLMESSDIVPSDYRVSSDFRIQWYIWGFLWISNPFPPTYLSHSTVSRFLCQDVPTNFINYSWMILGRRQRGNILKNILSLHIFQPHIVIDEEASFSYNQGKSTTVSKFIFIVVFNLFKTAS